jgi:hypothetical protein
MQNEIVLNMNNLEVSQHENGTLLTNSNATNTSADDECYYDPADETEVFIRFILITCVGTAVASFGEVD